MNKKIASIILAAGASSRMGQAKQLLRLDGISLIRRVILAALEAGADPVIVVTGANAKLIQREIADLTVNQTLNDRWPDGMGSSVVAGMTKLEEVAPDCDGVLLLLADQPLVKKEDLKNIIALFNEEDTRIAAAAYGEIVGVPAIFDRSLFPELLHLKGDKGARRLIALHPDWVRTYPIPLAEIDLDTPQDVEKARKLWRKHKK